ncbi:N-acetyltransferase [Leucothrix sargassi]|nr:N-acetyltransferase [Leucothrix sargassi]
MQTVNAVTQDGEALAVLRVLAMRESLEALGRFDPVRARERFLSGFDPALTKKLLIDSKLVAFYVLKQEPDHLFLDHLYVHPDFQGAKIGAKLLAEVIQQGRSIGKSVRLGALKGSRSNDFYKAHGFVKTHEEAFDNYYELTHS